MTTGSLVEAPGTRRQAGGWSSPAAARSGSGLLQFGPAAALAVALAACSSDSLVDRDPSGARACSLLAEAFGDRDAAVERVYAAGEAALESTTPDIRAATVQVAGDTWAHAGRMVEACRAQGVDMPEGPSLTTD